MRFLFLLSALLFTAFPAFSAEPDYSWISVNGSWETSSETKTLYDGSQKLFEFGYSDLINNRSLSSYEPLKGLTSVQTTVVIGKPESAHMFMIFFASKEYRFFHAFRFAGNDKKIISVQFIKSEPKDPAQPPSVKHNFAISVISEKYVSLDINKTLNTLISIDGKKAKLSINGKTILEAQASTDLADGYFGFSHRNNEVTISNAVCLSGKSILFADDFSSDRVKRFQAVFSTKVKKDGNK